MDLFDELDKEETHKWVSFLMSSAVMMTGADTDKALNFLSEVTATVYIMRGNGTADEFIVSFAGMVDDRVKLYKGIKDDMSFMEKAKKILDKDNTLQQIAKLTKTLIESRIPSSLEVKKDSMIPIFAGVYISVHAQKKHPMILAVGLCTSYILADATNERDLTYLSEMIMDSIVDKTFQRTVKHLAEFENSYADRPFY